MSTRHGILVAIFLVLSFTVSQAQTPSPKLIQYSITPLPYVFVGADLNGGGYQPIAVIVGGGIDNEYKHWFWNVEGMWDNAKKVNDNTGQKSGYTERAGIHGSYRFGKGWFGGAGASYTFLHTTLYDKNAWHPRLGFGRDCSIFKVPGRYQVEYVFPGTDTINAVQGFDFTVHIPNYADPHKHLFFRERLGTYWFHTTVTDPNNPELTHLQQSQHSAFSELQLGIEYRF